MMPTGTDGFVIDDLRQSDDVDNVIIADGRAGSLAQLLRTRPAKFVHPLSLTMY
jgi:hypothetical protein